MTSRYQQLLGNETSRPFDVIEPPFDFNAASVSAHAPEITGFRLLELARERMGWTSFADKTLLDFGCGVRFARTLYNLNVPFGRYVGVDIHRDAIAWLKEKLAHDGRFEFHRLNVVNQYYNRQGDHFGDDALLKLGVPVCDGATMFSVITHQSPTEAAATFRQLRRVVRKGGPIYFTAFVDETAAEYLEQNTNRPGQMSTYNPEVLIDLAAAAGWQVESAFPRLSGLQQPSFVAR